MLCRDDVPHVEVGVEPVAMTEHHGPYAGVASTHWGVLGWRAAGWTGRPTVAGLRTNRDDPAELRTEVYWLLA
jgi:hypothetical protein